MGLRVEDDILFTLYFVDDEIVMQKMIRKLKEEYENVNFTMNMFKCEYLVVENDEINDVRLDRDEIK